MEIMGAMKQALDALESDNPDIQLRAAIALRQAIEQAEQQEPVAWRYALDASVEGPRWIYIDKDPHQWLQGPAMVNAAIEELHTSPQPSKPWVGLTDEQVEDEWERITGHSIFGGDRSEGRAMYISPDEVIEFSRAIEAAHGIGEKA